MTTPNTKAVHKHPRGNDLVLSIVLEEASRVVRILSPNAEGGEGKGTIIEETRAQLLDPSSVKNLQVLLFRQGCKHHITTPAPRIEGGAIVLEIPAEVQQIGTYYVEISYDHEAPQLSDGHMRVTTHAPAVQIVPTSDAPTALDVVVSAHVLPFVKGLDGKDGEKGEKGEKGDPGERGADGQAGSGVSPEALDELREEMRESINQVYSNVDQQISGGLGQSIEDNRQAINALRGEIEALKTQQGGVSPEAIADLKRKFDTLERMVAGAIPYDSELYFESEDDTKDLSQGERDLIMASLQRAILAPWLATEEVWGKWWVFRRGASIKKLTTPTRKFKEDKYLFGDYRFQAVNGGTLVGNFYTLEQAMAAMTHINGDLEIFAYRSDTPHAIFDAIPADATKVTKGHIALDFDTATLSTVDEGDYELIKDTPNFTF